MVLSRYVGARVRRKEDPRLITGKSTYVGDLHLAGMLHVGFVRSQYAHANINGIDTSTAEGMPGVVQVIVGADAPGLLNPTGSEGSHVPEVGEVNSTDISKYPLAIGRVRYVGEPVAAVIAETEAQARDAADTIMVDYEPLPAVTDMEKAVEDGAPQLYDDKPSNISASFEKKAGDIDAAFADAPVKVQARIRSQRLSGVPMETRGVVAAPDPLNGGLTIWQSTQAPHLNRAELATALGMATSQLRVIAPEVGGGFGVKIGDYPEDFLIAGLARQLGRPLKWIETRSEHMMTTHHGRDQIAYVEAAADSDGRIRGLKMRVLHCVGGYDRGSGIKDFTVTMSCGCYDIPAVEATIDAVFTNQMAVSAYRGAGRPEAAYYIERVMDLIADEAGLDPVDVRRKNFIPPEAFPYTTTVGERYDTGEYDKALTKALEISNYSELRKQQEEARKEGRYIGIGLASYVEICGFGPNESSQIRVDPGGAVRVFTGLSPHGQGQETTFAQMAADRLGADFQNIFVHHGDTGNTPIGNGTMGSRGLAVGGAAISMSLDKIYEKACRIAAHMLEASIDDIEMEDGKYRVAGSPDQSVTLTEIADAAYSGDIPEGMDAGLESVDYFTPDDETFPFGTHIAVVEVEPDTGEVTLLKYFSVDDCGPRISPQLVEGQVHGGLTQGIAQALWEEVHYDDGGQLLSGSLMDYSLPKAHQLINFTTDETVTTTPINPLGSKGIGEAATIGSTPAVANAVIDALEPFGVTHLDVPMTAERVWNAMQGGQK
jgi:aerobic carbon-monoxide dehydrogenase large subunit